MQRHIAGKDEVMKISVGRVKIQLKSKIQTNSENLSVSAQPTCIKNYTSNRKSPERKDEPFAETT